MNEILRKPRIPNQLFPFPFSKWLASYFFGKSLIPTDHLASIYGTEKDKVNCSFYFKIGACRHGDRCSRKHVKPNFSQTVLLPNMYLNPANAPNCKMSHKELQEHFDLYYEDFMIALSAYGEIEDMVVCDNIGDHITGSTVLLIHL